MKRKNLAAVRMTGNFQIKIILLCKISRRVRHQKTIPAVSRRRKSLLQIDIQPYAAGRADIGNAAEINVSGQRNAAVLKKRKTEFFQFGNGIAVTGVKFVIAGNKIDAFFGAQVFEKPGYTAYPADMVVKNVSGQQNDVGLQRIGPFDNAADFFGADNPMDVNIAQNNNPPRFRNLGRRKDRLPNRRHLNPGIKRIGGKQQSQQNAAVLEPPAADVSHAAQQRRRITQDSENGVGNQRQRKQNDTENENEVQRIAIRGIKTAEIFLKIITDQQRQEAKQHAQHKKRRFGRKPERQTPGITKKEITGNGAAGQRRGNHPTHLQQTPLKLRIRNQHTF